MGGDDVVELERVVVVVVDAHYESGGVCELENGVGERVAACGFDLGDLDAAHLCVGGQVLLAPTPIPRVLPVSPGRGC